MNGESIDFTKFHFFQGNRMMQKIKHLLSILGPGIFAIGYTIGTGSVTSMAKAGSQYGLQLVWVLALSCLFSGILMEAYGRLEVVTGETALYAIKRHLRWGKPLAVLIFIGVVMGQYTCLGSILTLSSGAIYETLGMFFPSLPGVNEALRADLLTGQGSQTS